MSNNNNNILNNNNIKNNKPLSRNPINNNKIPSDNTNKIFSTNILKKQPSYIITFDEVNTEHKTNTKLIIKEDIGKSNNNLQSFLQNSNKIVANSDYFNEAFRPNVNTTTHKLQSKSINTYKNQVSANKPLNKSNLEYNTNTHSNTKLANNTKSTKLSNNKDNIYQTNINKYKAIISKNSKYQLQIATSIK